jgi:hypothetical protein
MGSFRHSSGRLNILAISRRDELTGLAGGAPTLSMTHAVSAADDAGKFSEAWRVRWTA